MKQEHCLKESLMFSYPLYSPSTHTSTQNHEKQRCSPKNLVRYQKPGFSWFWVLLVGSQFSLNVPHRISTHSAAKHQKRPSKPNATCCRFLQPQGWQQHTGKCGLMLDVEPSDGVSQMFFSNSEPPRSSGKENATPAILPLPNRLPLHSHHSPDRSARVQ